MFFSKFVWGTFVALSSLLQLSRACLDVRELEAVRLHFANASIATDTPTLAKRIYRIAGPQNLFWPNGAIIYCFDSSVTNTATMQTHLQNAWKRWIDAGVDGSQLSFQQGTAAQCAAANRPNVLLISQNSNGLLRTSLGRVPAGSTIAGPSMTLDLNPAIGMQDVDGNIAHEIGHAFGLAHEHQRPDLWSNDFGGGTASSNVFAFNCQNLKDYATMEQNAVDKAVAIGACKNRQTAINYDGKGDDFSAVEFLPWDGGITNTFYGANDGKDFDKASIMMYGSPAGGAPASGGGVQNVLTYADGSAIAWNNVPSRRDVNGLNAMYGSAKKYNAPLYFIKTSPLNSAFNTLRRKQGGGGSSSSCS